MALSFTPLRGSHSERMVSLFLMAHHPSSGLRRDEAAKAHECVPNPTHGLPNPRRLFLISACNRKQLVLLVLKEERRLAQDRFCSRRGRDILTYHIAQLHIIDSQCIKAWVYILKMTASTRLVAKSGVAQTLTQVTLMKVSSHTFAIQAV